MSPKETIKLMDRVICALDVWIILTAPEYYSEKHILEARRILKNHGGIVGYAQRITELVKEFKSQIKP